MIIKSREGSISASAEAAPPTSKLYGGQEGLSRERQGVHSASKDFAGLIIDAENRDPSETIGCSEVRRRRKSIGWHHFAPQSDQQSVLHEGVVWLLKPRTTVILG